MQTPQPQDQVALLQFRVDALERTVSGFNQQLNSYVRERENDLKLKILQDTANHIEDEVNGLKKDIRSQGEEVKMLKDELQKRDASQRESQDKLQIRVLVWAVGIFMSIVLLLLAAYFSHILH